MKIDSIFPFGKNIHILSFLILLLGMSTQSVQAQTVAREWNEVLLQAIRDDYARPTVHARNLFHSSVAMYDAWAAFSASDDTYFLGKTVQGFECPFEGISAEGNVQDAQEAAMSYAVYRLMRHRFSNSPGIAQTFFFMDLKMNELGYDIAFTDTNYTSGDPRALGNYLGQYLIRYGQQDYANEQGDYENLYYEPLNEPMIMEDPGNPNMTAFNNWQPLTLEIFIGQSGDTLPINTPPFLSPEWGAVLPFALKAEDRTTYTRDGFDYQVYHDPGPPPYLDSTGSISSQEYQWGFALVSIWASMLDTADGVMWDVSPRMIGNNTPLPADRADYPDFYDLFDGGDRSQGYSVNPHTGLPYEEQIVPRADYARVLAEFWADGPDSETPPGHWFTIVNEVNDDPDLVKKYKGEGEIRDDLEWDVKIYLTLGGALHDVAITAWGIKGWYDYLRPVSAIRFMADQGQSSDTSMSNYSPLGIPLYPGYIEVVEAGDPLEGDNGEHIGKIKLYTWRGPDYIIEPETDQAGVGWILAERWWPYQRPSFVTPPFAGYVSGHSTYSRAAAEVLTMFTGDAYFPGGMGEFIAPVNEFLVFEDGPSMDIIMQWATYRDASDQCSLSRIWGGIHPPADDIPGRIIGIEIGTDAFIKADGLFDLQQTPVIELEVEQVGVFPSPVSRGDAFRIDLTGIRGPVDLVLFNAAGQVQYQSRVEGGTPAVVSTAELPRGIHFVRFSDQAGNQFGGEVTVY
jgi:hypothetical protein